MNLHKKPSGAPKWMSVLLLIAAALCVLASCDDTCKVLLTSELDGKAEASRRTVETPAGSFFKIPERSMIGRALDCVRSGGGKKYQPGDEIKVDMDVVLTYVWRTKPMCVVTLKGEGMEETKVEVASGSSFTVPQKEKEGHTLVKIAGAEKEYNPGDKIENITSDLTLIYSWNINHHSVKVLDGDDLVAEGTYKYGSSYIMPKRDPAVGFHCACYTDADGNSYPAGQPIKVTSDLVLTYKWEINRYNVHIISGDDNIPDEQVKHGGKYTPEERTWTGHTFLSITDGENVAHEVGIPITVTSDLVLTYNWEINRYSVHIISGDEEIPDVTVEHGGIYTPERRARSGYIFQNITDGENVLREVGVSIEVTSDLTLTYNWKSASEPLAIGDMGPGGGMIFFVDQWNRYPDWDYLEVSTEADGLGNYPFGYCCEDGSRVVAGTGYGIGEGEENTRKLVSAMGGRAWDYYGNHDISFYAAKICADYERNGCYDWFLPSKDELELIRKNLQEPGLLLLSDAWCWSSSEFDPLYAWDQGPGEDAQVVNYRGDHYCVRPVRAF